MDTVPPKASIENWRQYPYSVWGFTHVDSLLPVAVIRANSASALPSGASLDLEGVSFSASGPSQTVADALKATHTDGFLILKNGAVVAENYVNQQPESRHIVFSVSKSITATMAGVLVENGMLDPHAPVTRYVPEAADSAYGDCTIRHVLDMTVSIRFVEDYLDPLGDVARYRVAMGWNPPGIIQSVDGLQSFVSRLPKAEREHGDRFHYVSPNSDMLGWILERASGSSVADLLTHHLWQPMGAEHDAIVTLDRFGAARTAGGICTSLRDLARFGELVRNTGKANGRQVIPTGWIDDILHNGDPVQWSRGEMTGLFPKGRYRSKWYVPEPDSSVLCAIGIHGQWIYIDRNTGMVGVKQSSQPVPADEAMDRVTFEMFRALSKALA